MKTKLEWRSGILTLPTKQGIVAKKLKLPAELKAKIKAVLHGTVNCNLSIQGNESEYISMTESEWRRAYAAGSIQPNVPFLGSQLNETNAEVAKVPDEDSKKDNAQSIDEIANDIRTIGPTEHDFDRILSIMEEHPTVDWTAGKNPGSHNPDGQMVRQLLISCPYMT